MARILIVDDEPAMAERVSQLCRGCGHQPFQFNSSEAALQALSSVAPQLVIADLHTEKTDGTELLRECRENHPDTLVVIIGAFTSVEMELKAAESGAFDYITKPFKGDELQSCIQRALNRQASLDRGDDRRPEIRDRYRFEDLIGTSAKMQSIYRLIGKVADTESTILIQGEPGTGKELVARALHFSSSRQNHPFVTINCSALPDNELESELFGHKKGSFTGAVTDKVGLFEEGHNGTLFLDEIDSMSQQLQTRLLRVLQERHIRQVGDTKKIPVNVRSIAASNESLQAKTRNGGFREDLYFRLAVIPIEIPPLRERIEDVPLLVRCFLQKHADQTGTEQKTIDEEAMERLLGYTWPGNVRELENAIERACALSDGEVIRASDLPPQVLQVPGTLEKEPEPEWRVGKQLDDFVRHQERRYVEMTLKFNQGSREKTATMLGISIATLYRKLDLKHRRE
ncbi:MAG: sigma-54-dependent Fis family transcriptional regulator [Verrucomicrobia bacterium]|nr:sigma-54-dependent Fis family transcriptional regulator [Verrucomicrobiota bacterium]MBV9643479.1 sigma-54-dependent Fis family transcriptional regulator [Verrucomicrobiota bacterium]